MRTSKRLGLFGLVSAAVLGFAGCNVPTNKPVKVETPAKIRGRVINEARSSHEFTCPYAFAFQDEQTGKIYCYDASYPESTLIDAKINTGDLIDITLNPNHDYLKEEQIELVERAKSKPEVSPSDY